MDSLTLIHLQITLEYQINEAGLLQPFPGSEEQALYIVYQDLEGYIPYLNHKLPPALRSMLLLFGPEKAYEEPEAVQKAINDYLPCHTIGRFVSCIFTRRPSAQEFPDVTRDGELFVIKVDGKTASWAWSVRENKRCAELAVETLPEYRGRGYGRQVAAAWAHQVMGENRFPFYSYKHENKPSALLANSLGVAKFADVTGFE